jgi:serine protease
MKFRLVAVSVMALTVITSSPVAAAPISKTDTAQTTQVVVEFSTTTLSTASLGGATNAGAKYESSVGPKTRVYEVVGTPGSLELAQNITKLKSVAGVVSAEVDGRMYPMTATNDPLLDDQWALSNGYGVDAVSAWQYSQGEGVRVAVVDTGIVQHEDLTSNVLGGYDFISDPVTANDGNGRDSDPTDAGDWTTNELCGYTSPSSWHGTHVAGIIAAVGDNGIGVSGVAPKATIIPIRALGRCGGSTSDVFAGARWAA